MVKKPFSVGIIRNPNTEVSKQMSMEVVPHNNKEKSFHYKFTKGHDKLNCIFGTYKTHQFYTIREFGETIKNECTPHDVFVSGLAGFDEVEVLTPSDIQKRELLGNLPDNYIQRTKDNFNWANTPGVIAFDIDKHKDRYYTKEEVRKLLEGLFPGAPMLIKGSTSSNVYYSGDLKVVDSKDKVLKEAQSGTEAVDLTKKKGLRVYIVINSLSWIHKAKKYLEIKFWNLGTGFVDYKINGNEIKRCLIDLAMYSSPDRADFIKASLTKKVPNFYQDFGDFLYVNEDNPPFDVKKLKDITEEEQANFKIALEKERKDDKNVERRKKIEETYFKRKTKEYLKRHNIEDVNQLGDSDKSKLRKSINRLIKDSELDSLQPLYVLKNGEVSILTTNDIFESKESAREYHGLQCASILDPFYTPGKVYNGQDTTIDIPKNGFGIDFTKAKILSCNNPPSIMDQAHGGTRFFFDTEFFDIKNKKVELLDTTTIKLPIWNLTEIANCFLNQYDITDLNNINNFGNVLKDLEPEIGDYAREIFINTVESKESFNIWNELLGYGPSLFDFMNYNKKKKIDIDLTDKKLIFVNKIDFKYRMELINKKYFQVKTKGAKIRYLTKMYYKDSWVYDMEEKNGIIEHNSHFKHYILDKKGKTKKIGTMEHWINDYMYKKIYDRIEFYPMTNMIGTKFCVSDSSHSDAFNVYTGLNVVPEPKNTYVEENDNLVKKKGWHLMDKHLMDGLCRGDKEKYDYLLNWIANMFQFPNRAGETILAFQGKQGTGKNTFWSPIVKAFGFFGLETTNGDSITGQWNTDLSMKIIALLDEAIWEGDKKGHSKLKGLATSEYIDITEKYLNNISIKNTLHLVILTNHEAVAPMDFGDRRIVTFDVSDFGRNDRAHFGPIKEEFENGGLESFIYEMMHRDISKFNISKYPNSKQSSSAIESILTTKEDWVKWWFESLNDNTLYGYTSENMFSSLVDQWEGYLPGKVLFDSYIEWCKTSGNSRSKISHSKLIRELKNILVEWHVSKGDGRSFDAIGLDIHRVKKISLAKLEDKRSMKGLLVIDIDKCREALEFKFNRKVEWPKIGEQEL